MPRVKYAVDTSSIKRTTAPIGAVACTAKERKERIKHLDQILCRDFGVVMNLAEITKALGYTKKESVRRWLDSSGMLPASINGRDVWLSLDIATALVDGAYANNY